MDNVPVVPKPVEMMQAPGILGMERFTLISRQALLAAPTPESVHATLWHVVRTPHGDTKFVELMLRDRHGISLRFADRVELCKDGTGVPVDLRHDEEHDSVHLTLTKVGGATKVAVYSSHGVWRVRGSWEREESV
jgi:hypothetical protein